MVFRSLVLGLLGAIALLIAMLPAELEARRDAPPALAPTRPGVVHVSRRALEASPLPLDANLAAAIGLADDERIADIELEVTDGVSSRRVVVVVEP